MGLIPVPSLTYPGGRPIARMLSEAAATLAPWWSLRWPLGLSWMSSTSTHSTTSACVWVRAFPCWGSLGPPPHLPQVLCYLLFQVWSLKLLGLKLRGTPTPFPRPPSSSSTLLYSKGPQALLPSSVNLLFPAISSNLPSFYHISCQG